MTGTVWCMHCGMSLVGDDRGGWLHQYNWRPECITTYAEPRKTYA